MPLLETLESELKAIGPKVDVADLKILDALEEKAAAGKVLDKTKAKVRKLKAVRDPLRVEQMQLQTAVGNVDGSPPAQNVNGAT